MITVRFTLSEGAHSILDDHRARVTPAAQTVLDAALRISRWYEIDACPFAIAIELRDALVSLDSAFGEGAENVRAAECRRAARGITLELNGVKARQRTQ